MAIKLQCRLEKKLVKKVKPETRCEKYSQNVCAPSSCVITIGKKVQETLLNDLQRSQLFGWFIQL